MAVPVDTYSMISSLANNYMKNREMQSQYRQRQSELAAREKLAEEMGRMNSDPRQMARYAQLSGNAQQANIFYNQALKSGLTNPLNMMPSAIPNGYSQQEQQDLYSGIQPNRNMQNMPDEASIRQLMNYLYQNNQGRGF